MKKKILRLILLWVLLFSLLSLSVSTKKVVIPSQSTLRMGTIDYPASVDPAWAIDTASRALIFNVYDTLIFFDRESVSDFIPSLATDWLIEQPPYNDTQQGNQGLPDAPEGTNQTWYFRIRGTSGTHTMESVLARVPADYPVSTSWHETYPWYSTYWHIREWVDNPLSPDGILSPSDIIKMDRACQNWDGETPMPVNVTQTFHVDEVTITIILFTWKPSSIIQWTWKPIIQWTWKAPYEGNGTAELVEDVEPLGPSIGDTYHQLEPPEDFCRLFNITSHEDTNLNGVIDASEQFEVEYFDEPGVKRDAHMDVVPYRGLVVAEPEEDVGSFGPSIGDTYHQLSPNFSRLFNITSHEDTDGNGIINPSEQFDVEYFDEPGVKRDAHLDEIYINNIVVTEQPVRFHDGSYLTTEDVEYSFDRAMVQDRSGGPVWMFNEPLFGDGWPNKSGWPEAPGNPIDTAVESNSTHVWFNLAMPYPPFMQILCGSWASIVNKEFCVANGDWCGEWAVTGEAVGTGDGATKVFSLDYPPVVSGSETIYLPVMGEAVGTGDGTTTVFYLDYPPVLEDSETIYLDGSPTTAYTINYTTGGLTFDTAPGVGVAITADYKQDIDYTVDYVTGLITFTTAPAPGVEITADYKPRWKVWFDPLISPLDAAGNVMCGTGPYMLDYLNTWGDWRIVAFNKDIVWPTGYDPAGINPPHTYEYWGGWPAPHCSRYLDDVTNWVWYEWGIRKSNFETGLADEVYVPAAYLPQMMLNWPTTWDPDARMRLDAEGNPEYYKTGIECLPGLPTLAIDAAMFFTFNVNPASPYVGTGHFPNGIPLNFFSDARIRKAFAYCFDYDQFLEDQFWGEAEQPSSCVIEGLLYYNPSNPKYSLNLTKAKELFMAASADPTSPAYQVWDLGFTMTITFNTGHVQGETAATMMKSGVENLFALGPDGLPSTGDEAPGTATISVQGLTGPTFESDLRARIMPLFMTGWLNEYTDPHDNVNTFMHSSGHFSGFQSYSNATVDALIELGITTPNGPEREAIYDVLQLMYFQDCPSVCLAQPLKRHWERDWVQGWYYNPLYPGQKYFYHLWKGLDGDINGDNKVDILDHGLISGHWYPGPPVGPSGYDPIADIYPELQYVLFEDPYYPHLYDAIPKVWDVESQTWIPHPSIGVIDIFDAALVSAHWLEEV